MKRGGRISLQLGILGAQIAELPEHHPVVGRVGDGESHVRVAHRGEPLPTPARVLPCRRQILAKPLKALPRDGSEERRLVAEVTVERGPGHAESAAGLAERQRFHAPAADRPDGLVDERPPQVAMVITAGRLSDRRPSRGGGRTSGARRGHPSKDTARC